jgi:hypothetical protein
MKQMLKEAGQVLEASIFALDKIYKAFFEIVNPKGFLKKVVLLSILFLFINVLSTVPGNSINSSAELVQVKSPEEIYVESVKEKMKSQLIIQVDSYIKRYAPTSNLTPEYLVDKCIEYDVDIKFVLSQALLESHFGTKGKAAETNSVWNVGTYDNGIIKYRYKTADESIEPYLKLITEKYLIHINVKGDTIYKDLHHLVEDRGYTNYAGNRFASARGYEDAMRKLMVKIDMETSISFYQDLIKMPESQVLTYFKPDYVEKSDSENYYALNN